MGKPDKDEDANSGYESAGDEVKLEETADHKVELETYESSSDHPFSNLENINGLRGGDNFNDGWEEGDKLPPGWRKRRGKKRCGHKRRGDVKGLQTEENDEYQEYEKLLNQDEEWEEEHYLPEGWIYNDDENDHKNVQDYGNLLEGWRAIIDYFP